MATKTIDDSPRFRPAQSARVLKDNPGLAPHVLEAIDEASDDALDDALDDAQIETGVPAKTFDTRCPYDWDVLLMRPVAFDASRSPES